MVAGDSCRSLDILTTAASLSGISPDSAETGRGQQVYKLDSSKKHKDKRRERLENVVTQLHSRPKEDTSPNNVNNYDKDKSSDSSSASEDEVQKEFYLSSESEDDEEEHHNTYVDHGYDSRDGDDIANSDHHRVQRKSIYGGSHSSRSSFRSSLGSISPKYSKRKASTYIETRSPKRRYSTQQSPPHYSETESENELPTMVQRGTLNVKPLSASKKGPKKRGHTKIRDMIRKGAGGFVAPNAHRRGRMKDDDDKGKLTARALEYKNLPFRTQPIQYLMGTAIKYCKEGTIHDKFILMYYTRGQDVRRAVDTARSQLGLMVNLSISTPFLVEHTMPQNHSKETVRQVSAACSDGIQAVWDLDEDHTHDCVPRCSDFRTVMLQAATACDFLGSLKVCLQLAQQFPRQVCVRLCSIEGGLNPLPIYEGVVTSYANHQFEKKVGNGRPSYSTRHIDSDLD